jgi:hypothetical protein
MAIAARRANCRRNRRKSAGSGPSRLTTSESRQTQDCSKWLIREAQEYRAAGSRNPILKRAAEPDGRRDGGSRTYAKPSSPVIISNVGSSSSFGTTRQRTFDEMTPAPVFATSRAAVLSIATEARNRTGVAITHREPASHAPGVSCRHCPVTIAGKTQGNIGRRRAHRPAV